VATVTVSFTPLPAHVRTARFIAASVARRAGVAENVLDEVRLAVSEACSLAVRQHRVHAPAAPIELRLTDDAGQFSIQVADAVPRQLPDDHADAHLGVEAGFGGPDGGFGPPLGQDDDASPVDLVARERIGLAVIVGLVDDVEVEYLGRGSIVTMRWPIAAGSAVGVEHGGANLF